MNKHATEDGKLLALVPTHMDVAAAWNDGPGRFVSLPDTLEEAQKESFGMAEPIIYQRHPITRQWQRTET